MNERIRELIKSLGIIPENEHYEVAELIVRECILHLHKRGIEGFGILEERNLKEHFGVK